MKTNIYYFSATGNSLNFSKKLAREINAQKLIAISEIVINETVQCDAECIGIVCPVFAWGVPRIVREFLEKLQLTGNPYIFAVVSCVGIPGATLKVIQRILQQKKSDLNAGFVVKAPCSSLAKKNLLDDIIIILDRKRKSLKSGEERLNEIAGAINKQEKHKPETSSLPANYFGSIFHECGTDYFKKASKDFEVNDKCRGCGICVRVCPRGNINLRAGTPEFSGNCEFCHACIQWCPEFAIKHPNFKSDTKQYRNPNINLNELIVNA